MVCSGKLPCDVCFQKRIECKSTESVPRLSTSPCRLLTGK
jgi:hypothetical protein